MSVQEPEQARPRRLFGVVYGWVVKDPAIPAPAKGLYSLLCTYADRDGVCFPSNARLAAEMAVTERSIQNWLSALADAGALVREERFSEGRQTVSVTRLVEDSASPRVEASFTPGGEAGFVQNKTTMNNKTPPTPQGGRKRALTVGERLQAGADFERWWSLYPRKTARQAALVAYGKAWAAVGAQVLLDALVHQRDALDDANRRGFCPHASTWLNQRRYEDAVDGALPSGPIEGWTYDQVFERYGENHEVLNRWFAAQPGRSNFDSSQT